MPTTTLSPKFQLVVPREVRMKMPYRPGHKFEVMFVEDILEFVPVRAPLALRGIARKVRTPFNRADEDRY